MLYELVIYVCLASAPPSRETCEPARLKEPLLSEQACADRYDADADAIAEAIAPRLRGAAEAGVATFYTCKPKPAV